MLSHRFVVATSSTAAADFFDRALGELEVAEVSNPDFYTVDQSVDGFYDIRFGEEQLASGVRLGSALDFVLWHVTGRAVEVTKLVVVHAGVVGTGSGALVVPGPSGTGKTTLTAALVAAGFTYFSDEMAAIDPDTGLVVPVPRGLSLKDGSFEVLKDLSPTLRGNVRSGRGVWPLSPRTIGGTPATVSAPLRYLVRMERRSGGPTELRPIRRGEGLLDLTSNAFNLESLGRPAFHVLAEAVRSADCFRLTVGDLGEAVRLLLALNDGRHSIRPK